MIRKVFSLLSAAVLTFSVVSAQVQEPCGTTDANNAYRELAPDQIAKYEEQLNKHIEASLKNILDGRTKGKGTAFGPDDVLHIPVVVHVVHDYGAEYVTDNEIYRMVDYLTEVFMKRNSDTSSVIAPFKPYIGNPNVTFHLAAKDPKGNSTNGITRHYSYLTYGGDDHAKIGQWDPATYLNIWIENEIKRAPTSGQILAYAVFPSSAGALPITDGIMSGYQFINRDNTIPHEVGHILSLFHTWGNIEVATDCTGDDEVADTPPTKGHFSTCELYDTACTNNLSSVSKILLDTTLSPKPTVTNNIGFDYVPLTNLNISELTIYPTKIGEEFEITHYKENTPIKVLGTTSSTVGLPTLGSPNVASSTSDNTLETAGMRLDAPTFLWLDSFSIYPSTIGDTFEVVLLTFGKDTVKKYTGVTNTTTGPQVVPFSTYIPVSTYYRLYVSRNPGLKGDSLTKAELDDLNNINTAPAFELPGIVKIQNFHDTTGQGPDSPPTSFKGRYNLLYDIHIRHGFLTTTDSTPQVVKLDSFRADDVNKTYSIKLTKNPGILNDSITSATTYTKGITCVIDIKNETSNNRYNGLYSPVVKYGYIKNCIDYPDTVNTQNIMDYSSCTNMFTKGQVERMRATLASDVGNRDNLVNETSHVRAGILTGLGGNYISRNNRPDVKPVAAMSVEKVLNNRAVFLCKEDNFQFRQRSWRDTITQVEWTFSNGASNNNITQTGTQLNTVVQNSFSQSGWVDVTVKATGNNTGDSTTEYKSAVYAADGGSTINPLNGFVMDFEKDDANNPLDKWPIFNYYNNSHKWQVLDNVGNTGSGCISYRNYDNRQGLDRFKNTPRGDFDDFFTPAFDLSGMKSGECRLNFMSSGAFRTTDSRVMQDVLNISYSTDCGRTWFPVASLDKAQLANKGTVNVQYSPQWFGDWVLQSLEIPAEARESKVFFRFRFTPGVDEWSTTGQARTFLPGTGNNFYIDRINISQWAAGINTLLTDDKNIVLAPNPTKGGSQIILKSNSRDMARVVVTDVTGKVVYNTQQKLNGNINTINIPENAVKVSGVYMVHLQAGSEKYTEKLISY